MQTPMRKEKAEHFYISEKMLGHAHRRGVEPLTSWFVATHSIQLSYRRKAVETTSKFAIFDNSRVLKQVILLSSTLQTDPTTIFDF